MQRSVPPLLMDDAVCKLRTRVRALSQRTPTPPYAGLVARH